MVRVVLIPFFIVFLLLSGNGGANADTYRWIALAIFVVASLSDFLDGYVARHYNQVTDFGKFFDTLADKLLVTACLLVSSGRAEWQAGLHSSLWRASSPLWGFARLPRRTGA